MDTVSTFGAWTLLLVAVTIRGHPSFRTPPQVLGPEAEDTMTASGTSQGSTVSYLYAQGSGTNSNSAGGSIHSNSSIVTATSPGPGQSYVGISNSTSQINASAIGSSHFGETFLDGNSSTFDAGTGTATFLVDRTINLEGVRLRGQLHNEFRTTTTTLPPLTNLTSAITSGAVSANTTTSVITGIVGSSYGTSYSTSTLYIGSSSAVMAGAIDSLEDVTTAATAGGDSIGAGNTDAYYAPSQTDITNFVSTAGSGLVLVENYVLPQPPTTTRPKRAYINQNDRDKGRSATSSSGSLRST